MPDYKIITQCRLCSSNKLVQWLDLGEQPLANKLLKSPDEHFNVYPLKVLRCSDCGLSQLSIVVDPKMMFTDYTFRASQSASWRQHCETLANQVAFIKPDRSYQKRGMVLDIGANDGCLLKEFNRLGYTTGGIDPYKTTFPYFVYDHLGKYWDELVARNVVNLCGKIDVITATNVLAHVDDINGFLQAVHLALADDGIFVIEVPDLSCLLQNVSFDTIYHEHLSYFTESSIMNLLHKNGFVVNRFTNVEVHGGSYLIFATKEKFPIARPFEVNCLDYSHFHDKIMEIKSNFIKFCSEHNDLLSLTGYAASAKAAVFMHTMKITKELIPVIYDDNSDKQGKFIPGIGTKICNPDAFTGSYPGPYDEDFVRLKSIFVFSWNILDDIKQKAYSYGFKGKFIYRKGTEFIVED